MKILQVTFYRYDESDQILKVGIVATDGKTIFIEPIDANNTMFAETIRDTDVGVDPNKDPVGYVKALPQTFHGDYFWCSEAKRVA